MTTDHRGILAGKSVLITGASSGIGAAAARLFAREGASVVLTARRAERLSALAEEIQAEGGTATNVVADVTRAQDVERAVSVAVERYGRLDAAFNNAGYGEAQTSRHLTKALAAEYGAQGIRVNAIAPGTTRSEMIAGWFAANPDIEKELHRATPQQRTAEPVEIAEAAAWLCSDRASFVTGANLVVVDGGFTII
ncbi:SDR family NAD(P)-dependent oxidoreductase [Candidatus Frankia nodulisporulans]|uniref:SDR family NAD(P)-dependent oxidoreductase n=1 Tax=Candidatus Frankia nodulisporulans TaxID=2060052 RepID=UPI0013D59A82|nr:SDR family oxidoreductase [Candidatus Frankia nodulisporulans]